MTKNKKDSLGELVQFIGDINDYFHNLIKDTALPEIRINISYIIKNNITNPELIEPILGYLLEYVPYGLGEEEFLRLNDYYVQHHSMFAKEYLKMLNDAKKN